MLRKLARFFERAPELSVTERAPRLGSVTRALSKVLLYSVELCGSLLAPPPTPTTRPLR